MDLKQSSIESHQGLKETIESGSFIERSPTMRGNLSDYAFSPKLSSEAKPDGRIVSKPLEDMYPFLLERRIFQQYDNRAAQGITVQPIE